MKRSIDLQLSHHEYASTRIEVAIKEDNKLHRKFKLALRDEKKSKHEKDTYMRAKSIIKNDQQEALEELVQTGERSTVPPGVLQRYQEERAICEATLAAIAEEERQSMEEDGGYEAEDEVMEAATHLGYAPLMPDEAAEQANEIYNATPLGKDVQQRRQIVEDRIGEINAELWRIIWASRSHPWRLYLRRQQLVSGAKRQSSRHNQLVREASLGILMSFLMMTEHHAQAASWGMVAV